MNHALCDGKKADVSEKLCHIYVYIYIYDREREIYFSVHEKGINLQENDHLFICEFIGKLERVSK